MNLKKLGVSFVLLWVGLNSLSSFTKAELLSEQEKNQLKHELELLQPETTIKGVQENEYSKIAKKNFKDIEYNLETCADTDTTSNVNNINSVGATPLKCLNAFYYAKQKEKIFSVCDSNRYQYPCSHRELFNKSLVKLSTRLASKNQLIFDNIKAKCGDKTLTEKCNYLQKHYNHYISAAKGEYKQALINANLTPESLKTLKPVKQQAVKKIITSNKVKTKVKDELKTEVQNVKSEDLDKNFNKHLAERIADENKVKKTESINGFKRYYHSDGTFELVKVDDAKEYLEEHACSGSELSKNLEGMDEKIKCIKLYLFDNTNVIQIDSNLKDVENLNSKEFSCKITCEGQALRKKATFLVERDATSTMTMLALKKDPCKKDPLTAHLAEKPYHFVYEDGKCYATRNLKELEKYRAVLRAPASTQSVDAPLEASASGVANPNSKEEKK